MNKFPIIRAGRVILNQLKYTDISNIVEYAGNINVSKMTLNIPYPYTEEDAIFWINSANQGFKQKTQYTFAIRYSPTKAFMGGIGLRVDQHFDRATLGYWIAEPYWNMGYGTEAVKGILAFGFNELNLHKIYATHLVENPASGRVMIKNGMIKEGELRDHTKKDGQYRSLIQYGLLKSEFQVVNEYIEILR